MATHPLDDILCQHRKNEKNGNIHFGKYIFHNEEIFQEFSDKQRKRYCFFVRFDNEKSSFTSRQRELLKELHNTGEYPPLKNLHRTNKNMEELLESNSDLEPLGSSRFRRYGRLLVEESMVADFENAMKGLSKYFPELLCATLATLREGGDEKAHTKLLRAPAFEDNCFSRNRDKNDFYTIRWNPHGIGENRESIKIPPAVSLFHEMSHAVDRYSNTVDFYVLADTPNQQFGNCLEKDVMIGRETGLLKSMALSPRTNHKSLYNARYAVGDIFSTKTGMHVAKNDEPFKFLENHTTCGIIIKIDHESNEVHIKPDTLLRKKNLIRYRLDELAAILQKPYVKNQEVSLANSIEILQDSISHKDNISLGVNEGFPFYINDKQLARYKNPNMDTTFERPDYPAALPSPPKRNFLRFAK